MDDIVTRLIAAYDHTADPLFEEAADEIIRIRGNRCSICDEKLSETSELFFGICDHHELPGDSDGS